MPDHESDMWRRAFVRLVKRGADPAQGNVLGVALSNRDARRSNCKGHRESEKQKLALFHGRIITIVERIPSSQRRGGAKRKRDSAQPQEKGEASIEVRRNRWNAGLITITASRYRARASRPSAPLRRLRDNSQWRPPLLCEEGNISGRG